MHPSPTYCEFCINTCVPILTVHRSALHFTLLLLLFLEITITPDASEYTCSKLIRFRPSYHRSKSSLHLEVSPSILYWKFASASLCAVYATFNKNTYVAYILAIIIGFETLFDLILPIITGADTKFDSHCTVLNHPLGLGWLACVQFTYPIYL
jgi:hypothetical protein